jgi:hypothetical protein
MTFVWTHPYGTRFIVQPPQKAKDVLDLVVPYPLYMATREKLPFLRGLVSRIESMIVGTTHIPSDEPVSWESLSLPQRRDLLHEHFGNPEHIAAFLVGLRDLSGLSLDVLRDIRDFFARGRDERCSCPVCEGVEDSTDENRVKFRCLHRELREEVKYLMFVGSSLSESEPVLDQPYWLYQVVSEIRVARQLRDERELKKLQDRQKSEEIKRKQDEILTSKGVNAKRSK